MDVTEIIARSKEDKTILIIQEALFCKVYEESAWRFVHWLRPYKAIKKFVKKLNQEIVSIGFPKKALDTIKQEAREKGFQIVVEENNFLVLSVANEPDRAFNEWKNNIKLKEHETDGAVVIDDTSQPQDLWDIVHELATFSIMNSTPMQSVQFLADLQEKAKSVRKMPE
ncbi:MAG: hypothetical protein K0B08_04265 [Bacteroidales bacterium]|nr:hypothetical protein [Bacteroidales bacterium]